MFESIPERFEGFSAFSSYRFTVDNSSLRAGHELWKDQEVGIIFNVDTTMVASIAKPVVAVRLRLALRLGSPAVVVRCFLSSQSELRSKFVRFIKALEGTVSNFSNTFWFQEGITFLSFSLAHEELVEFGEIFDCHSRSSISRVTLSRACVMVCLDRVSVDGLWEHLGERLDVTTIIHIFSLEHTSV